MKIFLVLLFSTLLFAGACSTNKASADQEEPTVVVLITPRDEEPATPSLKPVVQLLFNTETGDRLSLSFMDDDGGGRPDGFVAYDMDRDTKIDVVTILTIDDAGQKIVACMWGKGDHMREFLAKCKCLRDTKPMKKDQLWVMDRRDTQAKKPKLSPLSDKDWEAPINDLNVLLGMQLRAITGKDYNREQNVTAFDGLIKFLDNRDRYKPWLYNFGGELENNPLEDLMQGPATQL